MLASLGFASIVCGFRESGIGAPGRTSRMRWSAKAECMSGISIFGMWQFVQPFVATGQAAPG